MQWYWDTQALPVTVVAHTLDEVEVSRWISGMGEVDELELLQESMTCMLLPNLEGCSTGDSGGVGKDFAGDFFKISCIDHIFLTSTKSSFDL